MSAMADGDEHAEQLNELGVRVSEELGYLDSQISQFVQFSEQLQDEADDTSDPEVARLEREINEAEQAINDLRQDYEVLQSQLPSIQYF